MKATVVIPRLPTRAVQISNRGIPTAMPHEASTSSVRITHSMA